MIVREGSKHEVVTNLDRHLRVIPYTMLPCKQTTQVKSSAAYSVSSLKVSGYFFYSTFQHRIRSWLGIFAKRIVIQLIKLPLLGPLKNCPMTLSWELQRKSQAKPSRSPHPAAWDLKRNSGGIASHPAAKSNTTKYISPKGHEKPRVFAGFVGLSSNTRTASDSWLSKYVATKGVRTAALGARDFRAGLQMAVYQN